MPGWDLARARLRGDGVAPNPSARAPADERRSGRGDGPPLRVLHLVANRWWTGSADPIIQLVVGPAALAATTCSSASSRATASRPRRARPGCRWSRACPWTCGSPVAAARATCRGCARSCAPSASTSSTPTTPTTTGSAVLSGRAAPTAPRPPWCGRSTTRARLSARLAAATLYRRTAVGVRGVATDRGALPRGRSAGRPRGVDPGAADLPRFGGRRRRPRDPRGVQARRRAGGRVGRAPRRQSRPRAVPGGRSAGCCRGCPEARLLLVGKGERRDRLEQLVRRARARRTA